MNLIGHEERLKTVLYKKGILITNRADQYKKTIKRLTAKDIIKAIEKNPRLIGPTIILLVQHQKIFEKLHLLPEGMVDTILHLRKGLENGPDYMYEKYEKLFQLCGISNDGRVKGVHKKIRKNFRFDEKVIRKLHDLMDKKNFKTETEALEDLILQS